MHQLLRINYSFFDHYIQCSVLIVFGRCRRSFWVGGELCRLPMVAGCGKGHVWYGMVCGQFSSKLSSDALRSVAGMVWCGMVWYGMVWYGVVWYGVVW